MLFRSFGLLIPKKEDYIIWLAIFWLWPYLINVTPVTRRAHKIRQEKFEDTKGVIGIRKSKKDRQHKDQKKKDKRTNNDLQNIHINLKIEKYESH
jgi:hypothetical protein